jgi:hypothetical protein
MSFREKSAWISFLTLLLAAGIFIWHLAVAGLYQMGALHVFLLCLIGVIVLQVVLNAIAAALTPADAKGPLDERERGVVLRSHRVGYYVLVAAVMAMFFTGHLTAKSVDMIYHAFAAVTASMLSISLTQIVLFRLGR